MENFTIRSYGRTELAQCYFPDLNPQVAHRKLQGWINYYPNLRERLNAAGVPVDYHFVKGSCHGFDQLFRNSLSDKMIGKRVKFIKENII